MYTYIDTLCIIIIIVIIIVIVIIIIIIIIMFRLLLLLSCERDTTYAVFQYRILPDRIRQMGK